MTQVAEYRIHKERKVMQDAPVRIYLEEEKAAAIRFAKRNGCKYIEAVNFFGLSLESKSIQYK